MILSLLTNKKSLIKHSIECGVDRIMIDLEFIGKKERQSGKNLFQSTHKLSDIKKINNDITLIVRVNSINPKSKKEIDDVIDFGANIIMLPFFKTLDEVNQFIKYVNGRAKISLLIETKESLYLINELIKINEIDEFHIGLNDLCLSFNKKNIFELIVDGTVEKCLNCLKLSGKPYGFGGVGSINNGSLLINPKLFLFEQLRTGCSLGWLGRSFRDNIKTKKNLCENIKNIRDSIDEYNFFDNVKTKELKTELYKQIKIMNDKITLNHKKYRI